MKEINIMMLTRTMNYGGTEKMVLELSKTLKNKVNKIIIVSSGGAYEEELKKEGLQHFHILDIGSKNPFSLIKTALSIKKIAKSNNINIIHSHHRILTFICNVFCKGVVIIHTAHYTSSKNSLGFLLGKNIIAVSDEVKSNLINNSGVHEEDITVIKNGISISSSVKRIDYITKLRSNGDFIIVSVARLSHEKGIDIALKNIKSLMKHTKRFKYIIVGDGDERTSLEGYVQQNNLESHVIFEGFRSNPLDYIKSCDLLLNTSRQEGLPIVLLEAMSLGVAIVATNVGGVSELVKDGKNGFLIPLEESNFIYEKLIEIIEDRSIISDFGNYSIDKFSKNYTVNIMGDRYYKYYLQKR